jgi:hypothetical protein
VPPLTRWLGTPLPAPEYVPLMAPDAILDWFQDELRAGQTPHLQATVSAAVALCRYAEERGRGLNGVYFGLDAEMVSAARLAAVTRTGAAALPTYGARETGLLGHGCTRPTGPDDMHLNTDTHAVIQAGTAGGAAGLPADCLLFTSLRQSWPVVLLNASLGDRADLSASVCGCLQEQLGWTTHISMVRSFEKLSLGGPFVMLAEVVELLEAELPRRFGGGPTDYQLLLADQHTTGEVALRLRVHPRLGALDERAARETVLAAVQATGLPTMLLGNQSAGWLAVERQAPEPAPSGKVLPIKHGAGGDGSYNAIR